MSGLRVEQHSANGKLRGIGIACYAELTGLGTSTAVARVRCCSQVATR